jgi:hypothetical protein
MPHSKNTVSTSSHHKPTDQTYVRIPDGNGGRRVVYLGKHGSRRAKRNTAASWPSCRLSPQSRSKHQLLDGRGLI